MTYAGWSGRSGAVGRRRQVGRAGAASGGRRVVVEQQRVVRRGGSRGDVRAWSATSDRAGVGEHEARCRSAGYVRVERQVGGAGLAARRAGPRRVSAERGRASATSRSGPAPRATSSRASRLAPAFELARRSARVPSDDQRGRVRGAARPAPRTASGSGGRRRRQRPVSFQLGAAAARRSAGVEDVERADRAVRVGGQRAAAAARSRSASASAVAAVEQVGGVLQDARRRPSPSAASR